MFAGVIDLASILGLFSNFIHLPLCSTMNKKDTIDVLDNRMRLALQAVAHNVFAELRDINLLAFLHLHIFYMTLKPEFFLEYDASEFTDAQLAVIFLTSRRGSAKSPYPSSTARSSVASILLPPASQRRPG